MLPWKLCEQTGWPLDLPVLWRQVLPNGQERGMAELGRRLSQATDILPPQSDWFAAFKACSPGGVKVLLLGQDPYHGAGQAHGLAFSVRSGMPEPPSLRNILKELQSDVGGAAPGWGQPGVLSGWASQGVLLLNRVLTVTAGEAGSHQHWGWEALTEAVVAWAASRQVPLVVILWGKWAQSQAEAFEGTAHLVLQSPHPSPLSAYRGFFGSKPFSQANEFLQATGQEPLDWNR
jgi:uracil-DNA glycosylase